jgi:EmrB/QacA subfamily drug resistance transporter
MTSLRSRQSLLLATVALGQFISAIDYNIVYVALPRIGAQMHLGPHDLQWVVSAFAVALGGMLLLGGRATDTFGRTRVFRGALAAFGVGSAMSALAPTSGALIGGRVLQGLAAALMTPAMLACVHTDFAEGAPRQRALAVWSGAGAAGLATGSLLGGILTQALGWRAVFAVNVLLVLVTLTLSARGMVDRARAERRGHLDLAGALLATGAVGALVFALVEGPADGWGSRRFLIAAITAALLGSSFVTRERRSSDPLLPTRLLARRFLRTAIAATFVFMASFGTEYYLFTVYFQNVLHYSVLATGVAFLPAAVIAVLGTHAAGRLLGCVGAPVTLLLGFALGSVGMVAIAAGMGVGNPYWSVLPGIALMSVGQALGFTAVFAVAGHEVGPAQQGVAAALASTTLQIGSAVGLAVLVGIADAPVHAGAVASATVTGLCHAGYGAAIIAAVGVPLSVTLVRHEARQSPFAGVARSCEGDSI